MKILIPSQYKSQNTYVSDLVDEFSKEVAIVTEPQNFWTSTVPYNAIFIQWPEELFFWKRKITDEDLVELKLRLNYYKNSGVKLFATMHNFLPHLETQNSKKLYDIIYNTVDGIINHGQFSTSLYPDRPNFVINHTNYNKHYKVNSTLEIDNTFLSYGKIRIIEEEQQIIDGFLRADIKDSKLVITNSLICNNPHAGYKNYFKIKKYNNLLHDYQQKGITFVPRSLSASETELHFNNSKVIICPRIGNLNSGVVYKGFTFGKVVVGPSVGNIKEVLQLNKNPTFEPLNVASIADAFRKAILNPHIGELNKKFSDKYCAPDVVIKEYLKLI